MNSDESIDWSQADWSRENPRRFWDPSRRLLKSIRTYQRLKNNQIMLLNLRLKICVISYRFWSVVTGAEIDLNCNIGGGLLIPHPNGIVIHPEAQIGVNCLIFQQVTLAGPVKIGYHVDIGAGAKLLAPLNIENNVRIGANAVVTKNVKDGLTVVGVPAAVISVNEILK